MTNNKQKLIKEITDLRQEFKNNQDIHLLSWRYPVYYKHS